MSRSFRKPAKPFVLKNIKPKAFQELLNTLGACDGARYWAEKKSLKAVLKKCNRPEWLNWLFDKMTNPGTHWSYSTGGYTITEEQATAWGGRVRFKRAEGHAYHAEEVIFNKEKKKENPNYAALDKATADIYRAYYAVE